MMSLRRIVVPLAAVAMLAGCSGLMEADPAPTSSPGPSADQAYADAVRCTDQSSSALRAMLIALLADGSEGMLDAAMAPYWDAAHATTDSRFGDALMAANLRLGEVSRGEVTARTTFEELAEVCGATTELTSADLTALMDKHVGLLVDSSARTETAPYIRFEGPHGAAAGEAIDATLTEAEKQGMVDELFGPAPNGEPEEWEPGDEPRTRAEEMLATPPPAGIAECMDGLWDVLAGDFTVTPDHVTTAASLLGETHPTVAALQAILADGGTASMVGVDNACFEAAA
jgi:uncharacterized protein YceK